MKTKGYVFACAKIAFTLLVFLSAMPVTAQVSFASNRSLASAEPHKRFTTNFLAYYNAESNTDSRIIDHSSKASSESKSPADVTAINSDEVDISFKATSFFYPSNCKTDVGINEYSTDHLLLYAKALKQYAIENDFDTSYAFFSNMAISSSKKRFFVVNLITMKIEEAGLVAQGRGLGQTRFDKQYSNKAGSKCTSLGRYKIMNKYKGEYGESYRMAGLDSSNENAYDRNVVLHPMGCIPDQEDVMPACISEGCPAVSVKFLSYLSKILDKTEKPVLLWVFDSNLEEIIVTKRPKHAGPHNCTIHHDDMIASTMIF